LSTKSRQIRKFDLQDAELAPEGDTDGIEARQPTAVHPQQLQAYVRSETRPTFDLSRNGRDAEL
jgi:hypothetical protein